MIQVLLLILKIIGITLAVLLLTVLLLLAVVLFVPIRYRARVVHNPQTDDIRGRVSFLFPLVVFKFRYFEKVFSYKGRALWYVFAESGKNKEEKTSKKNKGVKKEKKAKSEETEPVEYTEPAEQLQESPKSNEAADTEAEETKEILEKIKPLNAGRESEKQDKKKNSQKEKSPKEKPTKEKGENTGFLETIKRIFRQKDEAVRILSKAESKTALRFAWEKLKKTICHIIPRKIKGYLIYGSADPATTGQVLGVVSMLYAVTGPVLKIVPDFENERLECDLEFKGRLQIFTLLVILLKIYVNKELKQLIQELKAIKEIE